MLKTPKQDLLKQEHLARIISSSNDAILSICPKGKITSWNASAERFFGYKSSEVLEQPFNIIIPKKYISENEAAQKLIRAGKIVKQYETYGKNNKGKKFHISISLSPIKVNEVVTGISMIIKKTGYKFQLQPEMMLKGNQPTEFNNTFLSNFSHEIRTPLIAILGFADLLLKKKPQAQELEYIDIIKNSGEYLLKMINDILDISRIEGGMIQFETKPFSVKGVFKIVEQMLVQKVGTSEVVIKFQTSKNIPDILIGDPDKLTQIIINLVSNAIKFTPKGKITISAKVIQDFKDHVKIEFSVKDTGIGLSADQIKIIFDRFMQGNAETAETYGGSGLGLSIVKSLVELQGGKISVQSKSNKGSIFTAELCYKKNKIIEINELENIEYDLSEIQQLNVLLVEDNKLNIKLIESLFNFYKINISIAVTGSEALDNIKLFPYDIILMDVELPDFKGYEITEIIRRELMNSIPIIAMTAHTEKEEGDKCIKAGMNAFISKPINTEKLFTAMFMAIKQNTNTINI